jgi:hypothetical protein
MKKRLTSKPEEKGPFHTMQRALYRLSHRLDTFSIDTKNWKGNRKVVFIYCKSRSSRNGSDEENKHPNYSLLLCVLCVVGADIPFKNYINC